MIRQDFTFITPCFSAGAVQEHAELRAPAIRGQLRWWFRVLGGSPEMENSIFGNVHGQVAASKLVVRSEMLNENKQPVEFPEQNKPGYYLLHFAKVSGTRKRCEPEGYIAQDSTFQITVVFRQPLTSEEEAMFMKTWRAFCNFGSLGLRQTRTFGAFAPVSAPSWVEIKQSIAETQLSFWCVGDKGIPEFFSDAQKACNRLEALLGHLRQHGFSAGKSGSKPTPLGTSRPRQASALHLRPLQTDKGKIAVCFLSEKTFGSAKYMLSTLIQTLKDCTFKYPYKQKSQITGFDDRVSYSLFEV